MIGSSTTGTVLIIDPTFIPRVEALIAELERDLRPIANTPVDITQPGWGRRLRELPHPLDRVGIREKTEALLTEIISVYEQGSEEVREALRGLFTQYKAFSWAATLPAKTPTAESFRQSLLLFSLKDQGRDSRDALLLLRDLCHQARAAGVDTPPILTRVAELSSDLNKYGMGSTKQMLLKAC